MKWLTILPYLLSAIKIAITDEVAQRITLGSEAHEGMFPYMVSIQVRSLHWCGGTIISPSWVLSAAHCCSNENGTRLKDSVFTITVGDTNWRDGLKYDISKTVVHPLYKPSKYINDIALFKPSINIVMGPNVKPIKLNADITDDDDISIPCVIVGWGNTVRHGVMSRDASDELRYVDVKTVPLKDCRKTYSSAEKAQICVFAGDGRGSCSADSGGPLVSEDVQIGLVSFGLSCRNNKPEVYTRVSAFYGWIRKEMKEVRRRKS